ncbi:M50 family metallopeptidase [Trichormus variabilis]|uniref:Peptidase M50 n=1 Tax=Trichormus variabilis SAG 1403-4b TaxID=447716 RepID=A0A3S1A8H2_ANAVA|nr:M50 family metallopeptidase [Trichormus variabilis]MBD2626664.1 M50 family metallopeptidase [Trichormus variabilis FACHB-164]RUS95794.1 peptidase M50 [Trichormus variabilis SAG 1403-4b]
MREPKDFPPFLTQEAPVEVERMGLNWLIGAAVATVFLWQLPNGDYILYPFTILATWFHEMGHGLMALMLGGNFQKLEIFSNGSGVATYTMRSTLGPIGPAMVAAAGPMGPPIAGAALILASRNFKAASLSLKILGGFLLLSTLVWVRSWFGLIAIPVLGIIILGIALKAPPWVQGFAIQFLGVQACVSTYHQLNYLFSYSAGSLGLSDTAQMQRYLLLPYWFWGGLMAVASLVILVQSLRVAYGSHTVSL